jgi:hypothetical protein
MTIVPNTETQRNPRGCRARGSRHPSIIASGETGRDTYDEALILEVPQRLPNAELALCLTLRGDKETACDELLQLRGTGAGAVFVLLRGAPADPRRRLRQRHCG